MEWATLSSQLILFIKIDFEKSYDRVEWNFILRMLWALGFGPQFIHYVSILFSNASTMIMTNGILFEPMNLQRLIQQGFPLLPFLYVLVVDALGYLVEAKAITHHIQGIQLPNDEG